LANRAIVGEFCAARRIPQRAATKYLAIGTFPKPLTPEQFQQYMPTEVPAMLQIYLDGKMEQFWLRQDRKGVVFLIDDGFPRRGRLHPEGTPSRAGGSAALRTDCYRPFDSLGVLTGRSSTLRHARRKRWSWRCVVKGYAACEGLGP
jgi:hypothetical protein